MKLITVVTLAALTLMPAAPSFATGKNEIKVLNESAAALTTIDPVLAARLKKFAAKESGEREEKAGSLRRDSAKTDAQEAQLLKDSAAALRPSRPDLAKKLERYSKEEKVESKGKHLMHR